MGIRFYCPKGHKLNVKDFQAGRKGICPYCGARIQIPTESTRPPSKKKKRPGEKPEEEQNVAAGAPSGEVGEIAGDFAPGPGAPAAAGSPSTKPAAAGAAEASTVGYPDQGPGAGAAGGLPAAGAAAQASPAIGPQNPSPTPAGFSPAAPAAPSPVEPGPQSPSPAADPLAEAGDVVWYMRPASGGQFGPASTEVMRSWLDQGRVGVDSLVWREGWPDWQQAAKVFPQLGTGQPDPPLGEEMTPAGASATGATAARSRRAKSLRQSKKTQTLVIILLIFAVIVLFAVFLWVVFG